MPFSFNQMFDIGETGFRTLAMLGGVKFSNSMRPQDLGAYQNIRGNRIGRSLSSWEMARKGGPSGMSGAIFGRPVKGFAKATGGLSGFGYLLPMDMALSAARAPRGHMGSALAGSVVGGLASVAGSMVGGAIGGAPGALVGTLVGDWIGRSAAGKAVDRAAEFGRNYHHMDFGKFRDNEAALTMRQVAARELGGSLMNARMYLGKEAMLMHQ